MPLVSVVIPTRNRSSLLPRAIASALGQTHRSMEVIVVDDASGDDTPNLLARLGEEDRRLRVVRAPVPIGAARARNLGCMEAQGSLLAFLDDDCVWVSEKLQKQIPLLGAGHGVAYGPQMIQDPDGRWILEGQPLPRPIVHEPSVGTNTLLLKKALFDRVGGFDERLPRLQDWDLLLRLARETSFAFLPEVLVFGVMVPGGITLTPGPLGEAARRVEETHSPMLNRKDRSLLHYILGKFLLVDGLPGEARVQMVRAVRACPWAPLAWGGLAVSLFGPSPRQAPPAMAT